KIIRNTPVKKEDMDPEYYEAVKDLLEHPVVQKMDTFKHHDDTTLFHTLTVSQISFYLAKKFNCDAVSVARGGLLHDLFLYDWRDGEHPNHPTKHAERALKNADKHFNLNDIERDIIAKHMWPVTRKFFKYKESFLVSIVDKIVSTKEVWNMGINWVINKFTNSEKEEIQKALDERKKVIQKKEKISDENNNNLDE
ncbi:MAG: HD domain-containing protein, partial [Spirochaetota bacterium]